MITRFDAAVLTVRDPRDQVISQVLDQSTTSFIGCSRPAELVLALAYPVVSSIESPSPILSRLPWRTLNNLSLESPERRLR